MRILFFGTAPFAVPALQALHESATRHKILAVVTQPDRPSGRGLKLHYSPVKEVAVALGYPVLQPERVRRKPFPAEVAALAPDALVVVAFGQIIPQSVLDLPRYGGINVHASLLPRWRGAAPIHHAIIAGDGSSGVATMKMEATLDTGPVYRVASTRIGPNETSGALEPRLARLGASLLIETLDAIEGGDAVATPQSDIGMTYAPPVTRADGLLDPEAETADELYRRIRGTNPRPGAFISIDGRSLRILDSRVLPQTYGIPDQATPGSTVVAGDGIVIAAAAGTALVVTRVQPENRAPMSAAEWARGARLAPGARSSRPAA